MTDFPDQGQTTPWRDQLKAYIDERDVGIIPDHQHPTSDIVGLTEAAQDAIATMLQGATGVSLSYNDAANTLTISAPGATGGLDAEAVRDAIGVALIGTNPIIVTVNDAADTITLSIAPGYFALAGHTHTASQVTDLTPATIMRMVQHTGTAWPANPTSGVPFYVSPEPGAAAPAGSGAAIWIRRK